MIFYLLSRYMRPSGPWQRWWAFLYTIVPCARTGLTGHNGPPTPPTEGKKKKARPQRKNKRKVHSRAGLGRPPLHHCPSVLRGHSPSPTHPTLVVRRNSRMASTAFASHRYRTDGACGFFHPKASPTSFHSLLVCGRHAGHLVKRWCLDWGSPLAHQQAGVSVLPKR